MAKSATDSEGCADVEKSSTEALTSKTLTTETVRIWEELWGQKFKEIIALPFSCHVALSLRLLPPAC